MTVRQRLRDWVSFLRNEYHTIRILLHRRIHASRKDEKAIVDSFHKFYYDHHVFVEPLCTARWFGVQAKKCPFDFWIYQELVYDIRPDLIVECGTSEGGSALFFASICELLGKGRVITIDVAEKPGRPRHPRIEYVLGASTDSKTVRVVEDAVRDAQTVMVILDSDHSRQNVLNELRIYHRFVTPGSYIVVEDTNINGHPVFPEFGAGPHEAVEEFLKENPNFAVDKSREKFYLTFNPNGYLKRIR